MSTIQIYRVHSVTLEREVLGTISEEDLDFLADNLQEEFEEDQDYYIDQATVEYLKDQGAGTPLISLLHKALEDEEEGIEIGYQVG
jgi:hypothetical protein